MIDCSHPVIGQGSKDVVNLSTRNPDIVSKLRNHNPALVNDSVRVETLKIERPPQPRTESAGSARTPKAQNGVIVRNVGDLRVFHDQKPIESCEQAGNGSSFQRQPERTALLQDAHLRHELSLRREVRGITAHARCQFLDLVCNHALKPGHTVTSSQLHDSKRIEFRYCGAFRCRPVIFCKHSFIIVGASFDWRAPAKGAWGHGVRPQGMSWICDMPSEGLTPCPQAPLAGAHPASS